MVVSGGITASSPFAVEWPTGEADLSESRTSTATEEFAPAVPSTLSPFATAGGGGYGEAQPGSGMLGRPGEAYPGLSDGALARAPAHGRHEGGALAAGVP